MSGLISSQTTSEPVANSIGKQYSTDTAPLDRQLLIADWRIPKASANKVADPSFLIALSNAFMPGLSPYVINLSTRIVLDDITACEHHAHMGFKENLKAFRLRRGFTQEQLAHACGWASQSRVGNYEKGTREPNLEDIQNLATALDVNVHDLLSEKENTSARVKTHKIVSAEEHDGGIPIKFLEVRGSCGGGAINWEERDGDPLIKESSWFKRYKIRPKDAIAIWADGDSMADYIVDGDIVVFDTSKKAPKSGHIFLIQHPDGTKIKKLRLGIDGSWMLESNNLDKRRFPDERISPDQAELLVILGEFVYRQGG